jgi:hypothetical protein
MKLKYLLNRNDAENRLVIEEYGELDKDQMVAYCEVSYELPQIKSAIKGGETALIAALRNKQFYPSAGCAKRLARTVMELFDAKNKSTAELYFDDKESFAAARGKNQVEDAVGIDDDMEGGNDEETEQLDTLLKDDIKLKSGEGSLKVEDIESSDPAEGAD